jgi:hypothetical protein
MGIRVRFQNYNAFYELISLKDSRKKIIQFSGDMVVLRKDPEKNTNKNF